MSQDAMLLANAKRLSTDLRTVTIDSKQVDVHLQKVLVEPSLDGNAVGALPSSMFDVYLKTSGGSDAGNVNGSGTPVDLLYTVPNGVILVVEELHLVVRDAAFTTSTNFGGLAALTNGVQLQALDISASQIYDVLAGGTWKANREIALIADSVAMPFADTLKARVLFRRADRSGIALNAGQAFRMRIRDDLSGLDELRAVIRGRTYAA